LETYSPALTLNKIGDADKAKELNRFFTFFQTITADYDCYKMDKVNVGIFSKAIKYSLSGDGNQEPLNVFTKVWNIWNNEATLRLNNQFYQIVVNRPKHLFELALPGNIMVAYHVYPQVIINHFPGGRCQINWYKRSAKSSDSESLKLTGWKNLDRKNCFFYIPHDEDLDCYLKVGVLVDGDAEEIFYQSLLPIQNGPNPKSMDGFFEKRRESTEMETNEAQIRVITYNIKADSNKRNDEKFIARIEYRKPLLIKEILDYKADIIGLQEMDEIHWERSFRPIFDKYGLHGRFAWRHGGEGLCLLFREQKFELLAYEDFVIYDKYENQFFDDFGSLNLKYRFANCQLCLLQVRGTNKMVFVANTHFTLSDYKEDFLGMLQAKTCLEEIEKRLQRFSAQYVESQIGVLFLGDFNQEPLSKVYKSLVSGKFNFQIHDKENNERTQEIDYSTKLDLHLRSACNPNYTYYKDPHFTVVDYIFYGNGRNLSFDEHIDMVPHQNLSSPHKKRKYGDTEIREIPNEFFPSDHLSIGCTFKWDSEIFEWGQ